MRSFRDYQAACLTGIGAAFREGKRRVLCVLPTGTGKTVIFCELCRLVASRSRALILTHRQDLVVQTARRAAEWTGLSVGIEMADQRDASRPQVGSLSLFDGSRAEIPRIIVGSIQSLTAARCELIGAGTFGWVIVDEAHHATSPTWRRVIDFFADGGARVVGFTATPDRSDGQALGKLFETVAYEYKLQDAIAAGHLVPIKLRMVQTSLDMSQVRASKKDYNETDQEAQLSDAAKIAEICEPILAERGDRPGILFMPGVQSAKNAAAYLNAHSGVPGYAASLDGTMDRMSERDPEVAALRQGDRKILTNCALFTEGWDCPIVSMVNLGFRSKSRAKYSQCIGRGTRPAAGKSDLLVLDFKWLSEDLSVVAATDIFAGDMSDAVADFTRAKARATDGEVDLQGLLEVSMSDFMAERQKVLYKLMNKDPFAAVGIDIEALQSSVINEHATEAQASFLEKKGLKPADIAKLSKGAASTVISKLMKRADKGLCTPKQARALARSGVDARDFSFTEAGALLDFISHGGSWRPLPPDFNVDEWRRRNSKEPARS